MKMEYIYAAMLLHKAGKPVDEAGMKKVLEAAGVSVDEARIKAVVASLEGVKIDDVLKEAAAAPVAAPAAEAPKAEGAPEKKEKPKEEKKDDSEAAAGLGALFG
jgi:large subunit ribosomal protein L12